MHRNQRIGWREPFRARAHAAREYLRRRWYVPVASGATVALPAILFFRLRALLAAKGVQLFQGL